MRAYLGRHHVALIALFVALGGTSYAAVKLPANSVGSRQLKKGAVTPPKVARSTVKLFKGQRGAAGQRGPTGGQGPTGAAGAPAAGAVLGLLIGSDTLDYVNPTWPNGADITESAGTVAYSPNATMVARDLYVATNVAPGGVDSRAVTLRVNHVDTALGCTITGTATTCTSGATVTVPPGSILSMKLQRSVGASAG